MTRDEKRDVTPPAWPASRLGEAAAILAEKSGMLSEPARPLSIPDHVDGEDDERVGRWIRLAAARLSLEGEAVESTYPEVEAMIRCASPALIRLPGEGPARYLALLKGGRRRVTVIGPDSTPRRIPTKVIRDLLTRELEAPLLEQIDRILREAGVEEHRRPRARTAILRERLGRARVGGCWLLKLAPGAHFGKQLRHARAPGRVAVILALFSCEQLIVLLSWWIVGRCAFRNQFEEAHLLAWALLLITGGSFQVSRMWIKGRLSIRAGGLFKRRLLFGAMKLEPEETRRQGAGQFVGRVMESEALDAVALESGFYALFAVMQLVVAAWVLSMGAGGALHALLLPGWMVVVFLICARYYTRSRALVETCRNLTHDLVERMVGRRTRLAQEDPNRWHDEEDQALENYLDLSRRMDRSGVAIRAFLSRGWMIAGVIGILWAFMDPSTSAAALAVSVGGVLLALQALDHFNLGAVSLINARIAWEQAAPLFAAAARPGEPPSFAADAPAQTDKRRPVLMLRDVSFRYSDHGRIILKRCGVEVFEGDRLLLRGPSGSGKSTLASLAAGLRTPGSGLALFRGVDRRIMGAEQWRERAAAAPQFHENHVFTETFAFNLLMGRGWPPGPGDLKEAGAICRELGLGELIDRMPAGFLQMVGEGGWRLSHGERSRLFIARAILQSADVMILDESFAALDPENLQRALTCVLQRVPTLIVIANP